MIQIWLVSAALWSFLARHRDVAQPLFRAPFF